MKWRDSLRDVTSRSAMPAFRDAHRRAFGCATPPNGRRQLSPHGWAASRDTTVPDSTWHGVSRRGASDACLPKPLAQDSLQCNSYSLDGQACRAELFAGHPGLEEEVGGW